MRLLFVASLFTLGAMQVSSKHYVSHAPYIKRLISSRMRLNRLRPLSGLRCLSAEDGPLTRLILHGVSSSKLNVGRGIQVVSAELRHWNVGAIRE